MEHARADGDLAVTGLLVCIVYSNIPTVWQMKGFEPRFLCGRKLEQPIAAHMS